MLRTILVLFPALAFALPATSSADEPRWGGQQGYGQNVGKDIEQEMNFCVDLLQGVTQNRSCEVLSADECLAACDIAATGDDAARSCRSSCTAGGAMFCSTARWGGGYDQGFGKPGVGKPGFGKPVGPGQGLTPLDQDLEQELLQDLEQGFGKPTVGKDQNVVQELEQLEQGFGKPTVGKDQNVVQELEQLEHMVQDDTLLEQEMVQELVQELEQGMTQDLDQDLIQDLEQELIQDLEQGIGKDIGKNIGKDQNIGKPGFGKRWGKYDQGFGKYDQSLEQEILQELEQHFGKHEQGIGKHEQGVGKYEQGIGKYEQGIGKYEQGIGKPGFGKRWGKGFDQGIGKGELIYLDVTECEMLVQDLEQGVGKHTFGK
ncbi:hypothetical protein [Nannocystis pusilla]|uniref:Uncharacterized protein n=1 Tax=Nannocystis pusilla TaxID=889268 RepID=A0ABS7TU41_9BACT|nr:hypothetical protein [Nannocystis pusilla]MBZ5711741.1 hypothetical protein [Nannocystis pusilla]